MFSPLRHPVSYVRVVSLRPRAGGRPCSVASFRGGPNTSGYGNRGYYPYYGTGSVIAAIPAITSMATTVFTAILALASRGAPAIPATILVTAVIPPTAATESSIAPRPPLRHLGPPAPAQRRLLGIDEEPVVIGDGVKAMKVAKVYPGTAAEKAGLQAGDVIRSVNGYLTEQRGNLAWIIANATPDNELKLNVQTAKDGQAHLITATLPLTVRWTKTGSADARVAPRN